MNPAAPQAGDDERPCGLPRPQEDVMADPGDKYQPMVDFIRDFTRRYRYPPTVREMQAALGLSSSSVAAYWMWVLRHQERITWWDGASRTVRVVGDEVIHLTYDEVRMLRDLVGDADPKAVLMRAARDHANGLVPTGPIHSVR